MSQRPNSGRESPTWGGSSIPPYSPYSAYSYQPGSAPEQQQRLDSEQSITRSPAYPESQITSRPLRSDQPSYPIATSGQSVYGSPPYRYACRTDRAPRTSRWQRTPVVVHTWQVMIDGAIVSLSQLIPSCKRFLGPCQTHTPIRFLQFGTPKELEDTLVLALRSKRFLSKYFCFSLYFFSSSLLSFF